MRRKRIERKKESEGKYTECKEQRKEMETGGNWVKRRMRKRAA